ncbi:MAG: FkbM family methyltransferase [Candidatus Goldbacteria bacterium]|nr:FkbM family methyltransferase [Candidatus Goldiibacteriota bacterium]
MKVFLNIIRFFLKLIPNNFILIILFGPNKLFKWIKGSGINSMWLGTYERKKVLVLSKMIKLGMVCYDIGAHVGYYSLLFSRYVGKTGMVYAFEPLPRNLKYLNNHLTLNKLLNVKIIPYAVSFKKGYSKLLFENENQSFIARLDVNGNLKINTICIDELVKNNLILSPNIIKIDVEGHELQVLMGAKQTLINFKPIIFVALDNMNTKKNIFDFLTNLGYNIYNLDLNLLKIENIDNINEIIAITK